MHDHAWNGTLRVGDAYPAVGPLQPPAVTLLAAAARIERRAIQHDLHFLARGGAADGIARHCQRQHLTLATELGVADKLYRRQCLLTPDLGRFVTLELRGLPAAKLLLLSRCLVA